MRAWAWARSEWMENWWVRNLAQSVNSGYFFRDEFSISACPSLAGSEAPAFVEITFIFLLRAAVLMKGRRTDTNITRRPPAPTRVGILENFVSMFKCEYLRKVLSLILNINIICINLFQSYSQCLLWIIQWQNGDWLIVLMFSCLWASYLKRILKTVNIFKWWKHWLKFSCIHIQYV